MSSGHTSPARTAEHSPKRFLPLLTAVLAVTVDALPLPDAAPDGVAPLFTLAVLFYWALYEPALLTPAGTFGLGLLFDLLSGMPPGHSATAFLAARLLLSPGQPSLRAQPFAVVWFCFALAAAVVEALRWFLACLWWQHLFDPTPVLDEYLLTLASWPAVSYLLSRVRTALPRPRYGDGI
jgi:rod shape-determining protein MreD